MAQATLRVSVIVASRHRTAWLKRCLLSLRQQRYSDFEVVVVADPTSLAALDGDDLKTVPFDLANLAQARNLGIAQAAGDVCVFIDDDAVAEPLWLYHFTEGFRATQAEAAVGYVRGRNGISFQSKAASIDAEAETHEEDVSGDAPILPSLKAGRAVKLVGTNMAIMRDPLLRLGGFDEAYRFFLEDADLSMRLKDAGVRTVIVPLAQVHHGFAPSARRTQRRAPLDLSDIGRSTAYFLRRHLGQVPEEIWQRIETRERARVLRHMVLGTCEPRDVGRLLRTLRVGWQEGLAMEPVPPNAMTVTDTGFRSFGTQAGPHRVLASRWVSRRATLCRDAADTVASGNSASVFSFSLTSARHHVRFMEPGFWLQTGGVFGPSDRSNPAFRWCRFADRVDEEILRVANVRGISDIDGGKWWDH